MTRMSWGFGRLGRGFGKMGAKPGAGVSNPGAGFSPSLDFSDARNSQYIPLLYVVGDELPRLEDWQHGRGWRDPVDGPLDAWR